MLIGGDDISNDLSRIGLDRFRFTLIAGNSNSSVDGEPQGIELEAEFKFQRRGCNSPSFSRPSARVARRACSQAKPRQHCLICEKNLYRAKLRHFMTKITNVIIIIIFQYRSLTSSLLLIFVRFSGLVVSCTKVDFSRKLDIPVAPLEVRSRAVFPSLSIQRKAQTEKQIT